MTDAILYGGKGGVGKTTCAAATGYALANAGIKTLVVSTDPAHSLSDALETQLTAEPTALRENLFALEVDPDTQAERYEQLGTALAADLRSAGISLADAEVKELFASGTPAGGDELAALDLLVEYVDSGDWETVVFDTAPTGHTLRLLELPDVMGVALRTLRSLQGQVKRIGDSAKRMMFGPMYRSSRDEGFSDLQGRMERARELLTEPVITEFRVVTIPETMAIAESERLVAQLRTSGIPVETIVINRVLESVPHEDCPRCSRQLRRHADRVREIEGAFPDLGVITVPEADGEVHGLETLSAVAERFSV